MDNSMDYTNYTLEQLLQVRDTIDAQIDPQRAAQLDELIHQRQANQQQTNQQQADSAADAEQTTARQPNFQSLRFHGKANEFFSIWIVNVLLSIVTLGIYSAWATVRTRRYFYSNTEFDDHRFAYHGEPMAILRGRLIAVALFGGYFAASYFVPEGGIVVLLLVGLVTPWLIVNGLRFKMVMTSYRNVRWRFVGSYGQAYKVFLLYGTLATVTAGLLTPVFLRQLFNYIYNNTQYGNASLKGRLSALEYFFAGLGAFMCILAVMFPAFILMMIFGGVLGMDSAAMGFTAAVFGLYLLALVASQAFYTAYMRRHIFREMTMPNVADFRSGVEFTALAKLQLVNLLAMIFTLGLAYPWAKVRMANFMATHTHVDALPGLEAVVAEGVQQQSAIGDEVGDLFDVEVGLG